MCSQLVVTWQKYNKCHVHKAANVDLICSFVTAVVCKHHKYMHFVAVKMCLLYTPVKLTKTVEVSSMRHGDKLSYRDFYFWFMR